MKKHLQNCLCVIPARGGSKRIPRKNVVDFAGKPLIAHSIENALNSGVFDEVIVSTDDEQIASVAKAYKASVPFMRPKELCDDFISSNAAITHAIKEFSKKGLEFSSVCCLYATAPLIDSGLLRQAYAEFKDDECEFLFSACAFDYPIQRAFTLDNEKRVSMFDESKYYARSQDLTPAFHDAGAFYFGKSSAWLEEKMTFKPYAKAFLLPRNLVCDIDTMQDLEFAKILFDIKQNAKMTIFSQKESK